MHKVFYYTMRGFLWVGLQIFFKKIRIEGLDNIPQKAPVLFLSNHQNAFLDAILIVCLNHRYSHFLARADIFKGPVSRFLLSQLNLLPIYRIRDGIDKLSKNEAIIDKTSEALINRECLIMFPEGNHSSVRMVRPVSKGFARIIFRTYEIDPLTNIHIVPVGINYESPTEFRKNVGVYFGENFQASEFQGTDSNLHQQSISLRNRVKQEMEKLTLHIDHPEYDNLISILKSEDIDLTDPDLSNQRIDQIINVGENQNKEESDSAGNTPYFTRTIKETLNLNCVIINLIWLLIARKITDPVFIGSIKFSYVLIFVPLILLLQILILYFILTSYVLYGYIAICLLYPFYLRFWDEDI